MDLITFESEDRALADDFCQWFVGWTDAIGRFEILLDRDDATFTFSIQLPAKNIQMLDYIHKNLRIGKIKTSTSSVERKALARFEVKEIGEIAKLIVLFEEYPLRSEEKSSLFAIWHQAYEMYGLCQRDELKYRQKFLQCMEQWAQSKQDVQKTTENANRKRPYQAPQNQLSLFSD